MTNAQQIGMVPLLGCRCRCGHEWLPRDKEKPRVCPKCKSPRWDLPKKFERRAVSEVTGQQEKPTAPTKLQPKKSGRRRKSG